MRKGGCGRSCVRFFAFFILAPGELGAQMRRWEGTACVPAGIRRCGSREARAECTRSGLSAGWFFLCLLGDAANGRVLRYHVSSFGSDGAAGWTARSTSGKTKPELFGRLPGERPECVGSKVRLPQICCEKKTGAGVMAHWIGVANPRRNHSRHGSQCVV